MSRINVFLVIVCYLQTVCNAESENDVIASICADKEMPVIEKYKSATTANIKAPTEAEIEKDGNVSGIQPTRYEVTLSFQNLTHYSGVANIWIKVVENTKYILVNVKRNSPRLDYSFITVNNRLADNKSEEICIRRFVHLIKNEMLVIELSRELSVGTECLVTFGNFTSFISENETQTGAVGLQLHTDDGYSILHTNLGKGIRRSVFPCIDHFMVVTPFRLIIDVPIGYKVVSNTQLEVEAYQLVGTPLFRHVFKQAPFKVFAGDVAFALMSNYTMLRNEKYPKIIIWATQNYTAAHQWVIPFAQRAVDYLQSTIKFQLPLDKLEFVYVNDSKHRMLPAFGLSIWSSYGKPKSNSTYVQGRVINYIVSQWILNLISVPTRSEVCLLKALTSYMERLVLEELTGKSVYETLGNEGTYLIIPFYSDLLGSRPDNLKYDCSLRGPYFFHMIAQTYGAKSIESFVSKLVNTYAFGIAGVDEWDNVLARTLPDASVVQGYLRKWFTQMGPPKLLINSDSSIVNITQNRYGDQSSPKPMFLKAYVSGSAESVDVIFNNYTHIMPLNGSSWMIVDPDHQTLTWKLYSSKLYLQFFAKSKNDPHNHLTNARLEHVAEEFCESVNYDYLPLPNDDNQGDWKSILELVLKIDTLSTRCVCCLTPPPLRFRSCSRYPCSSHLSRLGRLLNFNYTISTSD